MFLGTQPFSKYLSNPTKLIDGDIASQLKGSVENVMFLNNIFHSSKVYSIKNSVVKELFGKNRFVNHFSLEVFMNMCDYEYFTLVGNASNRKRVQVKIILLIGDKNYPLLYKDPFQDDKYNVFAFTKLMTQTYKDGDNLARKYIKGLGTTPIYLSNIQFLGFERTYTDINLCYQAKSNRMFEISKTYEKNYSICEDKEYVKSLLLLNNEISAQIAYKKGFVLPNKKTN